ncbi:methyl-accepting chemotaxis protein [Gracilinema caldarium]|uniref:methyl-accepting chemotaxis protein n=1 Tax=Gracilinema caldarium TaxID=215591 RepID=UPI0026EE3E70|nr:methyl-accepting chemotaxis protein [Gracilinema caldarium]
MTENTTSFENSSLAIRKFVRGYNKSIVLNTVTLRSLDIIGYNLERIGSSLSSIVAAFEEIRATSQTTSNNADKIDAMMDGILTKNASTGAEITQRVQDINQAVEGTARLSALFADLAEKAKSIASVTGSIQDVSDRTNILAINASIEAARAGNVGKGFRIIANEVRTLAGQTGDFAKTIEATISDFESVVGEITKELQGFTKVLESFKQSFSTVLDSFQTNAKSIDETGAFLNQISGSIREETTALTDGLNSLEQISTSLKDTNVVFAALLKTYGNLDTLLDKEGNR